MSLGQNIYNLRTGREMSQLELAEALGVSRQSISKWETDASVPELEKLIKLSELFGVTLDELVRDEVPTAGRDDPGAPPGSAPEPHTGPQSYEPTPQYIYVTPKRQSRKTVGIILLCTAFLCILFLGISGVLLAGCIIALPFIVCGIICLCVKRLPGLWCAWICFFFATVYLHFATGVSWTWIFNIFLWKTADFSIQMIISAALLLCFIALLLSTAWCLRRPHIDLRSSWKKPLAMALVLIVLRVGLYFLSSRLNMHLIESRQYALNSLFNCFTVFVRTALPAAFLTLVSRCISWKK